MEGPGTPDAPAPAAVMRVLPRKPPRGRGLNVAWALFLLLGVPFGIMAILEYLATTGMYVDAIRPLWQPWPPDIVKSFLGIAAFAATLAHLTYRHGRDKGYHSGAMAGAAAARNIVEGR